MVLVDALRRSDIDLTACTIRIERTLIELQNGQLSFGPPKSAAGRRTVVFPELIVPELRSHLDRIEQADSDLVFVGASGAPLRRTNFRQRRWLPALNAVGLPLMHFHDLRHTGKAMTASTGVNLRELMARIGHSSTRAALVYLHSTDERQREIAASSASSCTPACVPTRRSQIPGQRRGERARSRPAAHQVVTKARSWRPRHGT